ncbi:nucleolin isoform X2 [Pseudophryne corroboree]|uniref:nucleolin isoform X2 n=1 Tax=Pseudophryne corroboree TaxID=495146 RepID=UPI003081774C
MSGGDVTGPRGSAFSCVAAGLLAGQLMKSGTMGPKMQGKLKKPAPPQEVDDSEEDEEMEEEEESSEEELEVPPKKTPAKKAATPAKATPGKKAATPAKPAVTPGKKGATPAGAKNDEESEEEQKPVAKKPAAKKPIAKKESEEEEDEEEEDEDDESEEEEPAAKKPAVKKPAAKKEESEDEEDSEDEGMEVTPTVAKGKKAVATAESDDGEEDDDDEEEDDEDDEEDEDDDEENAGKESAKRKKEMPQNKGAPEAKKQRSEGLSVYVANLNSAKDFGELKDALREAFTKKSLTVQDVRIGASRKFGYVEFSTVEEVEKALKLTGKKVLGLEIKVEKVNSIADKNKNAENKKERDARTLFVKNFPYSTTAEELQEIFENAKEIRLPTGHDGTSKGIAYVEFHTEADADKAIEEKQGAEVEGRAVFIDYTGEKSQSTGGKKAGPAGEAKVLVVNNLSYNATEESLQDIFEKATSIRIPQNNQGRPKGFAFVEFTSVEDAKEALESCNNTDVEGRTIRLEFSQGGGAQSGGGRGSAQTKTLFVRGLSEDTTEETLKEAFDGSLNARIVTDRDTGASKGFGFVDFSSAEDAKSAKDAMEDGEIDGNKVTLDFAKPKGEGQRGGRGGFGGRGGGRGGFGGRGGGRGGFGGRGGGRGGFGGRGGGRGGGFGGRGGGGFRGGKKIRFDD